VQSAPGGNLDRGYETLGSRADGNFSGIVAFCIGRVEELLGISDFFPYGK
jgi:hypothetical protein